MMPTPEEVANGVAEVYDKVVILASTPEGLALMERVRDDYPEHDE